MKDPANSQSKNKGGAPLGNTNALKHGFYSRSFRQAESKDLESGILGEFDDEIALLRVLILRTAKTLQEDKKLGLMEYMTALRCITEASRCLATLFRVRKVVFFDKKREENDVVKEALANMKFFRDENGDLIDFEEDEIDDWPVPYFPGTEPDQGGSSSG